MTQPQPLDATLFAAAACGNSVHLAQTLQFFIRHERSISDTEHTQRKACTGASHGRGIYLLRLAVFFERQTHSRASGAWGTRALCTRRASGGLAGVLCPCISGAWTWHPLGALRLYNNVSKSAQFVYKAIIRVVIICTHLLANCAPARSSRVSRARSWGT